MLSNRATKPIDIKILSRLLRGSADSFLYHAKSVPHWWINKYLPFFRGAKSRGSLLTSSKSKDVAGASMWKFLIEVLLFFSKYLVLKIASCGI